MNIKLIVGLMTVLGGCNFRPVSKCSDCIKECAPFAVSQCGPNGGWSPCTCDPSRHADSERKGQ